MLIFAGLGNPGPKHARQRHNIGFMAADEIIRRYDLALRQSRHNSYVAEGTIHGAPGKVRVKMGGGHAGHNGIRSISSHIGQDFKRVRIGIGHPGDKKRVHNYVLSDFPKAEIDWVERTIDAIADAVPYLVEGDDAGFMTRVAYLAPPPGQTAPD